MGIFALVLYCLLQCILNTLAIVICSVTEAVNICVYMQLY